MTSPMISPREPSSNQLFSNMFDDEILQIAERYGAPNRLSPIAPWTSQCLAKFLASQNSPNSLTENQPTSSLQNQHSVFNFSPLEATSIQCFSEVPSPINISSNERLLDIVKQIDASSSERSPGTTKDEFAKLPVSSRSKTDIISKNKAFSDRNIAPNHCSPIKCSPGQPSPVGLSPCKPFSPELSMFEFSPVKVQRLPDVFSPLKTTSSDNSSNSFCQSRLRLAAPMKKIGPALCCCLDVLSPTKPLSDQSFSDDNEPLPLQPSSTNCFPNHHSPSESLASQHLLSGLPNEDVRQVHAQNNPAIDRKKYGAPLRRKKMPDGSWKTLPWIKQKGYVETPNSSNTIQRPSICFSPVKPLMSLCSSDCLSPIQHFSSKPLPSFSSRPSPDCHLPLKPSPEKRSPNRLSSRKLLMIQRSKRRVYRRQLSSGLSDEGNRPVCAQNNPAIDRKKYGAPLRRKKMPDGSWKTLPWIKQKGYVETPNSSNTIQRPSICFSPVKPLMSLCSSDCLSPIQHFSSKPLPSFSSRPSPDCHLPLKPSPEKRSPNRLSSRKLLMIQRSKRRVYRRQLSSGLSDEGNRPVCAQNNPAIDRKKYGAPLRRKKMPDGSWKTLPWIKQKGYVETPNSSNTIQRPSICFSPVKPLMSLCSSDCLSPIQHFSSKPLPSFSSRPSPDCHLPLKPSPEKRSPNRLSSRKLLMIQRSKRRVYRQQLSSDLSDEGNRPVCEKNKTLVANNCIGAPLKRKRMPDGCWKTLPWIKKQQLSSLSSKPLPSLSSQPLCSDWSDEGNLLVCENKIVNARIKNMPLGRIKMADGTWKTLQWIKPKGYVPKFYNC